MTTAIQDADWTTIEAKIDEMVRAEHPKVEFVNIWVLPHKSWCDMDMVSVWAVYDGELEDLSPPASPSLRVRIQDVLWDMNVDAWPAPHLVSKADAKDWRPRNGRLAPPE